MVRSASSLIDKWVGRGGAVLRETNRIRDRTATERMPGIYFKKGQGMTQENIDKIRAKTAEIFKGDDYGKQMVNGQKLLDELGLTRAYLGTGQPEAVFSYNQTINTYLQTEMMRNICESAEESCKSAAGSSEISRKSCRWAAIAAIASLACAVLTAIPILTPAWTNIYTWISH
jgi:hypothetical protein